ncbi:MAG: nucleotidyltransferase domain-containing protein [Gammaproteobacteria bacterium]|nr:nucleotidyltransferase domain-containing protein [Gammaproteobacteria bacterium]
MIHHAVVQLFGEQAKVWLFGSRCDDLKKGGDIDLLIQADMVDVMHAMRLKIQLLMLLEQGLGEQKVDVLLQMPDDNRPIIQIAQQTGILL